MLDRDASELVRQVAAHIGVDTDDLRSITINVTDITVQVYEHDEDGHKFVKSDGAIAMSQHQIPFTYLEPAVF